MTVPHHHAFPTSPEDRLLCQILRGDPAPWPATRDEDLPQRLLEASRAHGVVPLIHHYLRLTPHWNEWPISMREPLAHAARMHTAEDILREQELIAVLAALAEAGVATILLKGTPLAYSHYPEPALRTRCDTDVLVAPASRDAAMRALEALGYRRPNAVSGLLVSYEECFSKRTGNIDHVVDLHWQINNGQVFAQALIWDEALARSVPVSRLGASARALCPVHALLLACMHRAAHLGVDGPEGSRLLWLYDIHLLANAMTAEEWRDFVRLCVTRAMCGVSLDAFKCAQETFATVFPPDVMTQLARPATEELSAAYLHGGRSRLFLTELRALDTWSARATLLRESLFPPSDYLLAKYETRQRWLLPWWYVRRLAEGVRKAARP